MEKFALKIYLEYNAIKEAGRVTKMSMDGFKKILRKSLEKMKKVVEETTKELGALVGSDRDFEKAVGDLWLDKFEDDFRDLASIFWSIKEKVPRKMFFKESDDKFKALLRELGDQVDREFSEIEKELKEFQLKIKEMRQKSLSKKFGTIGWFLTEFEDAEDKEGG